jgi:cytochrome c oxidase subunit 2
MIAQASNFVNTVDSAFIFVVAVCVFFLALITTLMIVFVVKYNSKKNKRGKNIRYNVPLEITWTVVPIILVLIMFWVGWKGYVQMTHPPKDSMQVDVTAQMWQWSFTYKNGKKSDTLYVPLNKKRCYSK